MTFKPPTGKAGEYYHQAYAFFFQGKYAEAVGEFKKVLELKPLYEDVRLALAKAQMKAGLFADAEAELKKALETNPKYLDVLKTLGLLYLEQRRYSDSIQAFAGTCEKYPHFADLRFEMSRALYASGELTRAEQELRAAIEINSRYANAHMRLGMLNLRRGNVQEAILNLRNASEFDPEDSLKIALVAHAHFLDDNSLEALRHIEMAIGKAKDLPVLQHWKTLVLGKAKPSSGFFAKKSSPDPALAEIHQCLGVAYARAKKYNESVVELDEAVARDPKEVDSYVLLAAVYEERKDFKSALNALKQALQVSPDSGKAHFVLGALFQSMNQNREAAPELRKAVELDPENADAYYVLGLALEAQKQTEEAVKCWEKALTILPDFDEARQKLESVKK